MKKITIVLLLIVAIATGAYAQSSTKYAIGLRGGWGVEISGQMNMGGKNRLEADLGLGGGFNVFNLAVTYQTVSAIPGFPKGFNWYYGYGGDFGASGRGIHLAVAGQLGIEYNFPIPLQVSLDWRPAIGIDTYDDFGFYGGWYGFALGIRYKF